MGSEGYILNDLQNPGALQLVYDTIDKGATRDEDIKTETCLSEGAIEETVSGLRLLRLIKKSQGEYQAVDLTWETNQPHLDFQLSALENLAKEATPQDWGKQSVVPLTFEFFVAHDLQWFYEEDKRLVEAIDDWQADTKEYRPTYGDNNRYEFNTKKLGNWGRLAAYLGLIQKVQGKRYAITPNPDLFYAAIMRATDAVGFTDNDAPHVEIRPFIEWLNENLLCISLVEDTKVPPIISHVLQQLIQQERVQYVEATDTAAVPLAGVSQSLPGIEADANTLRVIV